MINLNNTQTEWQQGLTVAALLRQRNFIYSRIIVKINGVLIEAADYADCIINDGDEVKVIHLLAGGR